MFITLNNIPEGAKYAVVSMLKPPGERQDVVYSRDVPDTSLACKVVCNNMENEDKKVTFVRQPVTIVEL